MKLQMVPLTLGFVLSCPTLILGLVDTGPGWDNFFAAWIRGDDCMLGRAPTVSVCFNTDFELGTTGPDRSGGCWLSLEDILVLAPCDLIQLLCDTTLPIYCSKVQRTGAFSHDRTLYVCIFSFDDNFMTALTCVESGEPITSQSGDFSDLLAG